jgi:hypothetical protein
MCTALDDLLIKNSERAKEVFTSFADSALDEDRHEVAAFYLPQLTAAIPDLGKVLYDHLLRDPSESVRDAAYLELNVAIGYASRDKSTDDAILRLGSVDEDELKDGTGLTIEDARSLLSSYYSARSGENIYDPGLEAFKKLQGSL